MAKYSREPITTRAALELLDQLIMNERDKCLKIARRLQPGLTPDDILNSFDYPELHSSPEYIWHDGIAAGLETAHAAICAQFEQPEGPYMVRRFSTDPMAVDYSSKTPAKESE